MCKMAPNNDCDSFSVLFFNSNSVKGKLDDIKSLNECYKPDLISISETKIDDTFDDNELLGANFTVTRKDRTLHGGGVLVATRNDTTNGIVISSTQTCGESITSNVRLSSHVKFNLISMYRPPKYGTADLEDLNELIETDSSIPSIIIGDLNLPDITWQSGKGSVKPNSQRVGFHQSALDLVVSNDFKQLIHEPTHIKSNTLDLLLVNKILLDDITIEHVVLPRISDHHPILVNISCQGFSKPGLVQKSQRLNFKRADNDAIEKIFSKLLQHIKDQGKTIHHIWDLFKSAIEQAKSHIPTMLVNPKNKPWISRGIIRLIRKRDRAYNVYKTYPTQENLEYERDLAKEVKSAIRKAKKDYLELHITGELMVGNSKPLYRFISNSRGHSNQINKLEGVSQDEIPDKLADYFSNVFIESDGSTDHPQLATPTYPEMENVIVSKTGVKSLIKSMDKRKSSGPDRISVYLLQHFTERVPSFLDCLTSVLDHSVKTASVPQDWKTANICPLFKGGKRTLPENYRPISLTSLVSKICEHVICSSMWSFIDSYDILTGSQHGFRKGYNTTTQLLHVIHKANQALDLKQKYHIVSFDFSKAFDKVPHSRLIHKLKSYKFSSRVIGWIEDWLKGRTSSVVVNGAYSKSFPVSSGVPQGSVLGPLLFLTYINDMTNCVKFSECRLYADDSLLCYNESLGGPNNLQEDVTSMQQWALTWGMYFNVKKCAHMFIGKQVSDIENLLLNNEEIPRCDELKYLGVHIQNNLKWHKQIVHVTKKGNKVLGILKRCLSEASPRTKMIAFNTTARPILEYATPVWSPYLKCHIDDLDRVHRKSIRWSFRLDKYDSVTDTMIANNIDTLLDRRNNIDTKFLRKIEFGDYNIRLNEYITYNHHDFNTRGKTINPHYNTTQFQNCYFNRMRTQVKVLFPSDDAGCVNSQVGHS